MTDNKAELIENRIKRIASIAFYIALTIEIAIVILDKSIYIIQYEGQWFRLTFLLFLIKVCLTKYSLKEWIVMILFGCLGAVSYFITGRNEILRVVMMVAACKDMDFEHIFKYMLYATTFGCVVLVVLSFFGVGVLKLTADFRGLGETTRYCLGMGHPNALHCMFWAVLTLFLYAYKDKIKWFHLVTLFVANIGLFLLTDSRTGALVSAFTIILACVMKYTKAGESKTIYFMTMFGIFALLVMSVLLMCDAVFWEHLRWIDDLVNGRVLWTHMLIGDCKIANWLPFSTAGRFSQTDLGYVKMVYWYGYIPTVIYILLCFQLLWESYKCKDYMLMVIIASISVYSMFEGHDVSVYIGRNYLFFLFGKYWPQMFKAESADNRYFWRIFRRKCLVNGE